MTNCYSDAQVWREVEPAVTGKKAGESQQRDHGASLTSERSGGARDGRDRLRMQAKECVAGPAKAASDVRQWPPVEEMQK